MTREPKGLAVWQVLGALVVIGYATLGVIVAVVWLIGRAW